MTVPIVELETEIASTTLMNKLAEAGFEVDLSDPELQSCQVRWGDCEKGPLLLQTITSFAFSDWCYEHIVRRVGVLHDYLNEDEREYVSLLTYHALRKTDEDIAGQTYLEWQQRVSDALADLVHDKADSPLYINLDGLIRFRARAYLAAIDEGIGDVVEQFLADREYEEFVSMLRYMLDTQPKSTQVLHVFSTDDRVWISDSSGELVKDPAVSDAAQQVTEGGEVNPEDLAMSILITRAPREIVIHDMTDAAPWPSFAETVERVFLDRAVRCSHCTTCVELQHADERVANRERHRHASPDKYE